MIRRLVALLVALCVAGCVGGGSRIEAIYTLEAPAQPAVAGATSAQILVPEPRAVAALNSERIAVRPSALTLQYYPNVAYQDTAPKVLQFVLLDTFQNTGRVQAVGLPGQSLLINYQLVTDVRAFQAETFGGSRARIEVAAKLLNDSTGRVVGTRVFSTVVPIRGDGADAAAAGLNTAIQTLASEIVAWTLTLI
jgi:cholesterol transport system auxiliary component